MAKILVVDDDSRLRELLRRYLVDQGFEVKTVANAGDMDRTLREEHFRLIVLDLMLPGEDGLAICRRLRGGGESIPIITDAYRRRQGKIPCTYLRTSIRVFYRVGRFRRFNVSSNLRVINTLA